MDREIKAHCEPGAGIPTRLDWELGLLTQELHQEAVGESTLCHTQSTSSGFACTLRGCGLHQPQEEVKYPHMFLHGSNTAIGLTLPSCYYLPPLPRFVHYKFLEGQNLHLVDLYYCSYLLLLCFSEWNNKKQRETNMKTVSFHVSVNTR